MRLLRCWANEASTRGCATVCDPAALFGTRPRHCSRRLPAAAVRERHQQHPKRPLVTCGPWVSRLVAHVRLEFRAGAFTSLQLLRCSVPSTRAQLLGWFSLGKKTRTGGRVRVISRTIHVQSRDLILVRTRQAQASLAKRARPPAYLLLVTTSAHLAHGRRARSSRKQQQKQVDHARRLHAAAAAGALRAWFLHSAARRHIAVGCLDRERRLE